MFIKNNNKYLKISIPLSSSVLSLKELLIQNYNIDVSDLYYHKKKLEDRNSLYYYGIEKHSILYNERKYGLKGGEKSKLNWLQVTLAIIFLFIVVPFILMFGLAPIIGSILEYIVTKICFIFLNLTGNTLNNKPKTIIGNIVVFLIAILKIFFLFIFVYVLFGYAFTSLGYLMSGMLGGTVCKYVKNIKVCTVILAALWTMVYLLYNLPDIFIDFGEKLISYIPIMAIIAAPFIYFSRKIVDSRNLVVGSIPIVGAIMLVYFQLIDNGTEDLEKALSLIVSLGCVNPNKLTDYQSMRGGVNINAILLKNIPELRNYINKHNSDGFVKSLKQKYKMNKNEELLIRDVLKGGGEEFSKNFDIMDKVVNGCKFKIQVPKSEKAKLEVNTSNPDAVQAISNSVTQEVKQEKPSDLVCCNDEYLKIVSQRIEEVLKENDEIRAFLEEDRNRYLDRALNLMLLSLDKDKLGPMMTLYHSSGLYSKLFGNGLYGPVAKFMRILFCNVLNVSKEGLEMFDTLGGLERLAQDAKAGIVSGVANIMIYFFLIIFFILLSIF